jgi:hypothetical protein
MRKFTFIFLVLLLFGSILPGAGNAQTPDWTQVLQMNTFGLSSGNVVTADANNVYMAVNFSGPITFDGTSYSSIGAKDLLIVKMSSAGVTEWVKQFSAQAGGSISPEAIKVDANGNIFMAASFSGIVTIGVNTLVSGVLYNSFYARIDGAGNVGWATPFLSTLYGSSKIGIDGNGSSFLISKTSKLLKFSNSGSKLWEQNYPDRTLQAIAINGNDLYLGGALQYGTTNFGSISLTSLGGYNTGFLVKADLDGVYSNSTIVGGSVTSYGSSISDIVPDNNGNLMITGCYTMNLVLDTITITNSVRSYYTYIAKCDDKFKFAWAKSSLKFTNSSRDMFNYRLFVDNSNNLYEFGMISSAVTYGAVTLTPGAGNQVLFKFDADGNVLNGFVLQNASYDRTYVAQSGNVLIGGSFDFSGSTSYGNIYFNHFDNNLVQDWQKVSTYNLAGIAKINYIQHDASGNTYLQSRVIGYCDYFGTVINTNSFLTVISKHDVAGNLLWQNQIADISTSIFGPGFILDKDDNVLTIGLFQTSLTVGTTTLTSTIAGNEAYVAKYSPGGVFQWAAKMNLGADISPYLTVAADNAGKVLVSGVIDMANFIVKFDASGNQIWAKSFPMESYYSSLIATDGQNNIYLTSEIYSTAPITIGSVTLTQTNDDGAIVLVKFDPDGNALWAKAYGGVTGASYISSGWACDINVDATGNTYLWGWAPNNAKFGATTFANPLVTNSGWSYFLAKINTSGDVVWAKPVYESGQGFNYGDLLDLDQDGNVYVGGHFNDKISIDGTEYMPEGTNDFFTLKYSDTGVFQWIKTIPANSIIMNSLSIYDEDILSLAGASGINPTLGSFNIVKKGGSDCMVATMAILNPAPMPLNLPANAGSAVTFNIYAGSSWTAVSDQTWLTISSSSGTGCAAITFTAAANPTTEKRTAIVTITYSGKKSTVQTITIIQDGGTFGIADITGEEGVIYPNPARNILCFNSKIDDADISVFNSAGKLLINEHVNDHKINIGHLENGLYTLKIVDKTGIIIKKFVKQ